MRIELAMTSVSRIRSAAVTEHAWMAFETGVTHYDDPPPDHAKTSTCARPRGRLGSPTTYTAWVDVEDGKIVAHGQGTRAYAELRV